MAESRFTINYVYQQNYNRGFKEGWMDGWKSAICNFSSNAESSQEDEQDTQLELSPEWIEFFSRANAKPSRKDTDANQTRYKSQDNQYQQLPDLGGLAHRERINRKMQLYGQDVAKQIAVQEALLSATFDEQVASYHAKLWPQLPIVGAEGPSET